MSIQLHAFRAISSRRLIELTDGVPYIQQELDEIRSAISKTRSADEAYGASVRAAVLSKECPALLAPFWGLASTNPGLFEKLRDDRLLETYSIYGFFPLAYELVYTGDGPPNIDFYGRTRGQVAILRSQGVGLVVKPTQSCREGEIARIAGELGVGPRQHTSLPGFITEELVAGRFFTDLPPDEVNPDSMFRLGRRLGTMLAGLQTSQIYYNDATLSDPSGRSHLLVSSGGACRLIDFGVSMLLDRHPQMSREEVYSFVRTLPMFRVFAGMGLGGDQLDRFLDDYRLRLARTSREEIMSHDTRFMEEGLLMAAGRLGSQIVDPFHQGFGETYPL